MGHIGKALLAIPLLALSLSGPCKAQARAAEEAVADEEESVAGLYRAQGGPDMAAYLLIGPDGRFGFELFAGAMDLRAQGQWEAEGAGRIVLTTRPRPRPPELRVETMAERPGQPLRIRVTLANGRGLQGIDFRVGFDRGEMTEGYTQSDGWENDPSDKRRPLWIEMEEPIYGARLARTPVTAGANDLHVILTPQ
ncbi:MAG: hypothetical protein AB7E05_02125 [Sphingobium sp.]